MRASQRWLSKVAVLGASGAVGQPLSLLLKYNPLVSELALCDLSGAHGVAADVENVCSPAVAKGYAQSEVEDALHGAQLVLIASGATRSAGMSREDLMEQNAIIVRDVVVEVGKAAPVAVIGLITNPLNATVPIAAETLRKLGVYDPARLFGITTLDVIRARSLVAQTLQCSPYDVDVPVIGGHSQSTIIPLLSGFPQLTEAQVRELTHRIQFGGEEVIKAKGGEGAATLSMAYAAAEFAGSVLKALRGDPGLVEYAYVESTLQQPLCRFFASAVELGTHGVEKVLPVPTLNTFEESLLANALPILGEEQQRGIDFGVKTHLTPDG